VGECSFWYRPTRVVPDQRPLNGGCCIVFQEDKSGNGALLWSLTTLPATLNNRSDWNTSYTSCWRSQLHTGQSSQVCKSFLALSPVSTTVRDPQCEQSQTLTDIVLADAQCYLLSAARFQLCTEQLHPYTHTLQNSPLVH